MLFVCSVPACPLCPKGDCDVCCWKGDDTELASIPALAAPGKLGMVGGGPNPSPLPPPAGDGCAGPPPPNGLAAGELPVLGSKLLLFFVALRLEGEGSPSPNPTCSLPADGLLPSPNELTSAGVGRKNGFRNGASLPWLIESCPLLSRRSLPLLFGGTPNGEDVSPPPF